MVSARQGREALAEKPFFGDSPDVLTPIRGDCSSQNQLFLGSSWASQLCLVLLAARQGQEASFDARGRGSHAGRSLVLGCDAQVNSGFSN